MKSILREKFIKLRRDLPDEQRIAFNSQITDNLPLFAGIVAGYSAFRGEASVTFLNMALPVIDGNQIYFACGGELHRNKMGILEPVGGTPIIPDIILVPLVAFDDNCNRLGYGGGYYDRYFASHPHAVKIGIAYELQRTDLSCVVEPHDIKLDYIVTEGGCYTKKRDKTV